MSVFRADNDLEHLYPPFARRVIATLSLANDYSRDQQGNAKFRGFQRWSLFEGYRSKARQLYLYSQGRTRPGAIVTRMITPKMHGRGLAADIVWRDRDAAAHWDGERELWEILGHCARANGLRWGGDWRGFPDLPHVEPGAILKALWLAPATLWVARQGWR